jgi:urea carboxylase/allophanate hydrolase
MCIYATESPGGYQLLGRTAGIWDETKVTYDYGASGDENWKIAPKPWRFRTFDRISFYPVTDAELDNAKDDMIFIEEDKTLDLAEYDSWLEAEKDSIEKITQSRLEAFSSAPYLDDLLRPAPTRPGEGDGQTRTLTLDGEALPVGEVVRAVVPGRCFRVAAQVGDGVNEGDALAWVESNKMELKIISPVKGRVVMARTEAGDLLDANEVMFVVAKDA